MPTRPWEEMLNEQKGQGQDSKKSCVAFENDNDYSILVNCFYNQIQFGQLCHIFQFYREKPKICGFLCEILIFKM